MARRRKGPWKRKGETKDNHWYTTIGKQTIKVAEGTATYQQAYEKYVQILADNGEVEPDQFTIKNLVKRFLDWSKANRKPATHAFYERYLNSFVTCRRQEDRMRAKASGVPAWLARTCGPLNCAGD